MDELQKRILKGQRIKERRLFCGLSQTELGDKLNVKFTTISKYESGEIKSIDSDTLSLIADITDTDLDYFLLKTDKPEKAFNVTYDYKNNNRVATHVSIDYQKLSDSQKLEVNNFISFLKSKEDKK